MNSVPAHTLALALDDASKVGEARRLARKLAERAGFDDTECGRVALIATEAATNLHKHARAGMLLLRPLERSAAVGVELLALDTGPGMADLGRCLTDGYSTAGSPGNGLGAMRRLASTFDVYSSTATGTALLARVWKGQPAGAAGMALGTVNVPLAGEEVCGDSWAVAEQPGRTVVLVVDGLGHGLPAADAARAAVACFHAHASQAPERILLRAHEALRATRGAAMAVACVEHDRGTVRFAGVGNIAASVLDPAADRGTSMVSQNGTIGHALRKVQEFTYPWDAGALLVMHSDGLATRWQLDRYPGLAARHPALVAGVLYRDHCRGRDDATVVVARGREHLSR